MENDWKQNQFWWEDGKREEWFSWDVLLFRIFRQIQFFGGWLRKFSIKNKEKMENMMNISPNHSSLFQNSHKFSKQFSKFFIKRTRSVVSNSNTKNTLRMHIAFDELIHVYVYYMPNLIYWFSELFMSSSRFRLTLQSWYIFTSLINLYVWKLL